MNSLGVALETRAAVLSVIKMFFENVSTGAVSYMKSISMVLVKSFSETVIDWYSG